MLPASLRRAVEIAPKSSRTKLIQARIAELVEDLVGSAKLICRVFAIRWNELCADNAPRGESWQRTHAGLLAVLLEERNEARMEIFKNW